MGNDVKVRQIRNKTGSHKQYHDDVGKWYSVEKQHFNEKPNAIHHRGCVCAFFCVVALFHFPFGAYSFEILARILNIRCTHGNMLKM